MMMKYFITILALFTTLARSFEMDVQCQSLIKDESVEMKLNQWTTWASYRYQSHEAIFIHVTERETNLVVNVDQVQGTGDQLATYEQNFIVLDELSRGLFSQQLIFNKSHVQEKLSFYNQDKQSIVDCQLFLVKK